ncbi:MAG: hypothetical protein KAH46_00735 [Mycobacterium sp.]|nr:hypothetical protein [Mycobacterium sp.]
MRPQDVALPILRAALPAVEVHSWIPAVGHRTFPLVAVARSGGPRHRFRPRQLGFPEVDLTVVHDLGPVEAEELYEDALEALYDAVNDQAVVAGVGCLHSISEIQGAIQTNSPFADTWSVQGTIRLGVRSS